MKIAEPWFKWMGSKRKLVHEYMKDCLLPTMKEGETYFEPMAGSIAVCLFMRSNNMAEQVILGDENPMLIETLKTIRDQPELLATVLLRIQEIYNDPDLPMGTNDTPLPQHPNITDEPEDWISKVSMFKWFRENLNGEYGEISKIHTAATLLFLIASGFNGLVRYNLKLKFNTPFGHRKTIKFFGKRAVVNGSENSLAGMYRTMQEIDILAQDYHITLKNAKANDFIYLDPPYYPTSDTANFRSYYRTRWTHEDFVELAKETKRLCEKGCHVAMSNADVPMVHELFGFLPVLTKYNVKRLGSCDAKKRKNEVSELVLCNYEPGTFKIIPIDL
jgi:DNA adenine methylase|tara:strand:- start:6460 stop:7455 length:996 start_codon:yes stop_codon:yes gene_type:complete